MPASGGAWSGAHQHLQVVLRQDEQSRADDRAVHGAHAADHHHEQDVEHDREARGWCPARIAQPERHEGAGNRCGQGQMTEAAVR